MSGRPPLSIPSHEELSQLARDNPQEYEALRRKLIDSFIDSAPERIKPRLCGIQFQVESVRQSSRSALGVTVKVYELMWKSFLSLNRNWQDLARVKDDLLAGKGTMDFAGFVPARKARILEFRPRPHEPPIG